MACRSNRHAALAPDEGQGKWSDILKEAIFARNVKAEQVVVFTVSFHRQILFEMTYEQVIATGSKEP